MSRILLTGGAGQIGRLLAARLAGDPSDRLVLLEHHRPVCLPEGKGTIVCGDLLQAESLSRACADIETVVHLAAVTHAHIAQRYEQINVEGTQMLLEAASRCGVARFIYISSRAAGSEGGAYSRSKLQAEEAVKRLRLDWIIVRPGEVYGPGCGGPIMDLLERLQQRKVTAVIVGTSTRLSPLFVDDLTEAIARLVHATHLHRQTYVLCGPRSFTHAELVREMAAARGATARTVPVPVAVLKAGAVLARLVKRGPVTADQVARFLMPKSDDWSAAADDLDFRPRPLAEGLRSCHGQACG